MKRPLGQLKPVDLRSLWPNEAADFTPWLAQAENIETLGKALGIELEVENTEVSVGPFAADIVAKEIGTDSYVVIENQLGRTDHDHLGKAITYAAALGARTIVWVARQFTDEHQKALDWLNDHTSDELSFFAVQPELWQIDDSAPALRFNVLTRPAEARRIDVIKAGRGEGSEIKQLQLEWWRAFSDALIASRKVPTVQDPKGRYWFNVAIGRSGFALSNTANTSDNKIAVRLYMQKSAGGHTALAKLLEQRAAIEGEIGVPLNWDPNPNATDKTIVAVRDADIRQKEKWPEYCAWMVEMTAKFRNVFGPRIKAMDLSDTPPIEGGTA